jgi:hypothetical protein
MFCKKWFFHSFLPALNLILAKVTDNKNSTKFFLWKTAIGLFIPDGDYIKSSTGVHSVHKV